MTLKHPRVPVDSSDELSIDPLFTLDRGHVPRHELPAGEMSPDEYAAFLDAKVLAALYLFVFSAAAQSLQPDLPEWVWQRWTATEARS